jgi:hypothetical protein
MRKFILTSMIVVTVTCVFVALREFVTIHDLSNNMHSSDASVRYHAIRQLRKTWHFKATFFVSALVSIVRTDDDVGNIREALSALSEIAPDDGRVASLLLELLIDEEEEKRAGACSAFGHCKQLSNDVAMKLKRMAHFDPSPLVRIACAWSLHQHGVFNGETAKVVMRDVISSPGISSETRSIAERVLNGIP